MWEAFVLFLLSGLGDGHFKKREQNTVLISYVNYFYDCRDVLKSKGLTSKDLEIRKRVELILQHYENVKPVSGAYFPRNEYFQVEGEEKLWNELDYCYVESGRNWESYTEDNHRRSASAQFAYELVRKGYSRWKVIGLMEKALRDEKIAGWTEPVAEPDH